MPEDVQKPTERKGFVSGRENPKVHSSLDASAVKDWSQHDSLLFSQDKEFHNSPLSHNILRDWAESEKVASSLIRNFRSLPMERLTQC